MGEYTVEELRIAVHDLEELIMREVINLEEMFQVSVTGVNISGIDRERMGGRSMLRVLTNCSISIAMPSTQEELE